MFTRRTSLVFLTILASSASIAIGPPAHANGPPTLFQWYYEEAPDGPSKLDEPLVTDRPDFTEASTTVGQGVVQLEMGYTFTRDSEDGVRTTNHSFPETLLRVGVLADWLEFRADWNYEIERTRTGGVADTESGADDLTLGFKIALTEQQCSWPETAVILQLSVPTGGDAFTADEVLPGINYLYSWELNEDWSLAGSTGFTGAVDDETDDMYTQFSQSLSLGHKWSEKLNSYTEWYVLSPIGADTNRPENYLNGGFTYLFNNDVQWDIRAGVGLNEAADDFFAGTGLSLRYY
jgi:Putative MetA-pathway of phenol degradation